MIEVIIQLNEPPARLDKMVYWKKEEAEYVQKLQPEIIALLVSTSGYGPMELLRFIGNHLLESNFGPWVLKLMFGNKEGFLLSFNPPQFESDLKEVEPEVARVSRYERQPVI